MRRIYLIRHGQPATPGGQRICLSATDVPLTQEGQRQGEALGRAFSGIALEGVYSSDLLRARETAVCISEEVHVVPALRELGVGDWEGLTFQEIRQRFPETYALRGEDPVQYGIPNGENPQDCRDRAMTALQALLRETAGDIAVVAHAGVNRLILCTLLGQELKEFLTIPQPCGCINILEETDGVLTVCAVALNPGEL